MKLRTYWAIMEPPTLVILAVLGLGGSVLFHLFASFVTHRMDFMAFNVLTFLGPFFVGCIISHTLHAALHRPFIITLPNVRRNFLQWHLPTLGVIALLLASAANKYDHALPLPVAASVAFSGLCLMLPFETGLRWYGSTKLLVAIMGSMLLAAIWVNETRAFLLYLPWLTVMGSLALATLCCRLGFARHRLRDRARRRVLSIDEAPTAAAEEKQAMADSAHIGRPWTHGPIGDSTFNWLRAVRHETSGCRSGLSNPWVVLPVAYSLIAPAIAYAQLHLLKTRDFNVSLGEFIYRGTWEHEPFRNNGSFLQTIMLFLFWSTISADTFLRPQELYPISRARRARLTFTLSLFDVGMKLFVLFTSIVTLSWIGARLAGLSFQPTGMPDFVVLFLLFTPLIPFVQWLKLRALLSPKQPTGGVLSYLPIYLLGGALFIFITSCRTWLLSPARLVILPLAIVLSLGAYWAAVHHIYRRGDLLQRLSSE